MFLDLVYINVRNSPQCNPKVGKKPFDLTKSQSIFNYLKQTITIFFFNFISKINLYISNFLSFPLNAQRSIKKYRLSYLELFSNKNLLIECKRKYLLRQVIYAKFNIDT